MAIVPKVRSSSTTQTWYAAEDGAEGTSTARLISPPQLRACLSTEGSRSAEHCVTRVTGHFGEGLGCPSERIATERNKIELGGLGVGVYLLRERASFFSYLKLSVRLACPLLVTNHSSPPTCYWKKGRKYTPGRIVRSLAGNAQYVTVSPMNLRCLRVVGSQLFPPDPQPIGLIKWVGRRGGRRPVQG